MKDTTGIPDTTGTNAAGTPGVEEARRGPTWHGWVLSILAAILLSVAAMLLLGGFGAFRSDRAAASGAAGGGSRTGAGSSCCLPADAGK